MKKLLYPFVSCLVLNCVPLDEPYSPDRCEIKCQNVSNPVQCYMKCNPGGKPGSDQDSEMLSRKD